VDFRALAPWWRDRVNALYYLPFSFIVNTWPPIVIVPVRAPCFLFAETVYPTVPFPVPLDELTLIQATLAVAVHPQPLRAATLTVELPPPDGKVLKVGDME